MRSSVKLAATLSLALVLLLVVTQPAFADDCSTPEDCLDTGTVGGVISGVISAIAGAAIAAGAASAASSSAASAGAAPATAPKPPAAPPMVIDQRVVSGQEALDELIRSGAAHDGDCVKVPGVLSNLPPGVHGIAYTQTQGDCLDPEHTAVVIDWPHPAHPPETRWIDPNEDTGAVLTDIGFRADPVTTPEGETFIRAPENLPENASGIGHATRTVTDRDTGERVLVIDPDRPVVVQHWPTAPPTQPPAPAAPSPTPPPPTSTPPPPSPTPAPPTPTPPPPSPTPAPPTPTPPPPSPTPPPPSPTPPPPSPTPPPERQGTRTFRLALVGGGDGSYFLIGGSLLTVEIQELIHGHYGRRRYLTFGGVGISVGVKLPAGLTGPSEWVNFRTYQPTTLEAFEGAGLVIIPPALNLWIWNKSVLFPLQLIFTGAGIRVQVDVDSKGLGANIFGTHMGWWEFRD